MDRRIVLVVLGIAVAAPAGAAEVLVVSTPPPVVQDVPTHYELTDFRIRIDPPRVDIRLTAKLANRDCAKDVRGDCQTIAARYTDEEAAAMINTLNTADLRNNSLNKRVLNKLIADGLVPPGVSVQGTPGIPISTPTATATSSLPLPSTLPSTPTP